jgi:hypothetical protein
MIKGGRDRTTYFHFRRSKGEERANKLRPHNRVVDDDMLFTTQTKAFSLLQRTRSSVLHSMCGNGVANLKDQVRHLRTLGFNDIARRNPVSRMEPLIFSIILLSDDCVYGSRGY